LSDSTTRPPVRSWATLPGYPSTRARGSLVLVILLQPVQRWSSILAGAARLPRYTSIRFSDATGRTSVHASSSASASVVVGEVHFIDVRYDTDIMKAPATSKRACNQGLNGFQIEIKNFHF
jgi:hypothetical protein